MYNPWLKVVVTTLILFSTLPAGAQEYGSFTDERDDTTYKTVQIGKELWMAENMKYVADDITCSADTRHGSSVKNYGCLYSWADAQKVCPIGWHLPSRVEFSRLLIKVGEGAEGSGNLRNSSWQDGKNTSGFSALPAGSYSSGSYLAFGQGAYFWSVTECDAEGVNAYALTIQSDGVSAKSCHSQVTDSLAVRCVKDVGESPTHVFTDKRDGSTYKTVKIAGKTWLAENVKYIADDLDYKATSKPDEYGYLYNWNDAQKVCPNGWRLPTRVEYDRLLTQVGKGEKGSDNLRHKKWENGKNISGFGALPAGRCNKSGCSFFDTQAYFWSATGRDKDQAYGLYIDSGKVIVNSGKSATYLAVRCIQSDKEADQKALAAAPLQDTANKDAAVGGPQSAAENKQEQDNRYLISSVAIGAVGGGGGVISGAVLLAMAAKYAGTIETESDKVAQINNGAIASESPMNQKDMAALAQKGRRLEVGSYVAFGVAGAALITAVALGAKHSKSKKAIKNQYVTVAPVFDAQAAGFTVGGRW